MATPSQIKAARALIGWSMDDLAAATGVSKAQISNFENGHSRLQAANEKAIIHAFEARGVVFIGATGVERRDDTLRTLEGPDDFLKLLDDILYTLKDAEDKTVRMACVNYEKSPESVMTRLQFLMQEKIKFHSLIHDGGMVALGPCHALAEKDFHNNPKVIYADRVAFAVDEPDGGQRILILRNASLADAERRTFDLIWRMTKESQT